MKAKVDQDTCIGCALCAEICPEVFSMEGDKSVVYVDIVPKKAEDACREAADKCPVSCIYISE